MSKKPMPYNLNFIRYMARLFDCCNETFNDRFSSEELLLIAQAHLVSEWDIYPDRWSEEQIQACLRNREVPNWDRNEQPTTSTQRF